MVLPLNKEQQSIQDTARRFSNDERLSGIIKIFLGVGYESRK